MSYFLHLHNMHWALLVLGLMAFVLTSAEFLARLPAILARAVRNWRGLAHTLRGNGRTGRAIELQRGSPIKVQAAIAATLASAALFVSAWQSASPPRGLSWQSSPGAMSAVSAPTGVVQPR